MKQDDPLRVRHPEKLIQIERHYSSPILCNAFRLTYRMIDPLLRISQMNRIYVDLQNASSDQPFGKILRLLDTSYQVSSGDLAKIPEQGPLVVVANHPFGGIEGIILADMLMGIRPDTKVMGNYLLQRIEPIRKAIIPVDPFGHRSSVSSNAKTFRACLRWLKQDKCLIVFPAGEVSHVDYRHGRITDPVWSPHIARLIRLSGAHVLPVFFPGRNSLLFNLLGLIHPRLRTLMLPREMLSRQSARFHLFIGKRISFERMRLFEDDKSLTRWLRFNTDSKAV